MTNGRPRIDRRGGRPRFWSGLLAAAAGLAISSVPVTAQDGGFVPAVANPEQQAGETMAARRRHASALMGQMKRAELEQGAPRGFAEKAYAAQQRYLAETAEKSIRTELPGKHESGQKHAGVRVSLGEPGVIKPPVHIAPSQQSSPPPVVAAPATTAEIPIVPGPLTQSSPLPSQQRSLAGAQDTFAAPVATVAESTHGAPQMAPTRNRNHVPLQDHFQQSFQRTRHRQQPTAMPPRNVSATPSNSFVKSGPTLAAPKHSIHLRDDQRVLTVDDQQNLPVKPLYQPAPGMAPPLAVTPRPESTGMSQVVTVSAAEDQALEPPERDEVTQVALYEPPVEPQLTGPIQGSFQTQSTPSPNGLDRSAQLPDDAVARRLPGLDRSSRHAPKSILNPPKRQDDFRPDPIPTTPIAGPVNMEGPSATPFDASPIAEPSAPASDVTSRLNRAELDSTFENRLRSGLRSENGLQDTETGALPVEEMERVVDSMQDSDDGLPQQVEQLELKSFEAYRDQLLGGDIRDIAVDVSPPASPIRDQFMAEARNWTDRSGNVVASGKMVDLRRGYVIIEGDQGRVKVPYGKLSDDDWAAVAAFWRIPELGSVGNSVLPGRNWAPQTFQWHASALCHKPLYFENRQLERYGHTHGPILQPFHSTGHFFVSLFSLPYQTAIHPPQECMYALGYYRPGNCAPWLKDPIPISLDGIRRQTLFTVGLAHIP